MTYSGNLIKSLQEIVDQVVMCEECGDFLARKTRRGKQLCIDCAQGFDDYEPTVPEPGHYR